MRSDRGTENCMVAASQMALRHYHTDTFSREKSFRYGKSTTNTVCDSNVFKSARAVTFAIVLQRIEGWWAQLMRFRLAWWLERLEVAVSRQLM